MIESNYYVLRNMRLSHTEEEKRLQALADNIAQLKVYHKIAPALKRPSVFWLIVKYESLIYSKGE